MVETVAPPREDLDDLIARFRRDGFVLARGVISDAEVDSFGSAVDAAVAARKRNDGRSLEEKTPYEQSFIQCEYLSIFDVFGAIPKDRRSQALDILKTFRSYNRLR
jgi:hypothetical protein